MSEPNTNAILESPFIEGILVETRLSIVTRLLWKGRYFWTYAGTLGMLAVALWTGKIDGSIFATTTTTAFGLLLGGGVMTEKRKSH